MGAEPRADRPRLRLGVLAAWLAVMAVIAFVVNFAGAGGGHCDDDGCSGNFPEWLYVGSGWLVLACGAGLLLIAAAAALRHLR